MMVDPLNDKLIDLIRDRPCLYDPNNSESNSFHVKEQQWSEIAKKLSIDVTFLKKRWKVIRDRYRKEWNKMHSDPYAIKSSWRNYKQLSYLEPQMSPRKFTIIENKTISNVSQPVTHNEYEDFSEYVELLDSESDELNEVQRGLEHTRLIEIVKSHPVLYDPSHVNYTSRIIKQSAWEQIAKDLDENPTTVKLLWQELRDRFRREYKKMGERNSGSITVSRSSFQYYDHLAFLKPFFCRTATTQLLYEQENMSNIDDGIQDDEFGEIDEDASYQYVKDEADKLFKIDDRDCKIIQFVQNNPLLYDCNHPNYRNVAIRNRKWIQIGHQWGEDGLIAKDRWQALREWYGYSSTYRNDPNWHTFIELMSFLDQYNLDDADVIVKNEIDVGDNSNEYESNSCSDYDLEMPTTSSGMNMACANISLQQATTTTNNIDTANHQRANSNISVNAVPTITTTVGAINSIPHEQQTRNSHVKMFFDCVAAQIETENLPFKYFSTIQQEVLKVVHQQIASYLSDQQ